MLTSIKPEVDSILNAQAWDRLGIGNCCSIVYVCVSCINGLKNWLSWSAKIQITGILSLSHQVVLPQSWPMFFEKIEFWMPRKLAKTMRIFVEIEHIENRGVTFWPERIGPVFSTLGSGHESGQVFVTKLMIHWLCHYLRLNFGLNVDLNFEYEA